MKAVCFFIKTVILSQIFIFRPVFAGGVTCLYDSTDIEIKKDLTAVVRIYKDFKITSEEGLNLAEFAVPVNDFIEFSRLKGHTRLPDGKKIKIGEKDYLILTDRLGFQFGGKKAALVSLKSPSVGAVMHYEYRLDIKNLLYLPQIIRQDSYPVERIAVWSTWPRNANLYFDCAGFEKIAEGRSAHFFADSLPEIYSEPFACGGGLYLYLSADRFRFNKSEYKCESWGDVGFFFTDISGQDILSLARTEELARELTGNSISLEDTLKVLFDFVADSFSYVALRVGSGDFAPHSCAQIVERRFGDCKDKSILLSELYRAVGIEAFPVLIATSDYPDAGTLHPWPSFFDHAAVFIKSEENEYILDPSDPLSDISHIPLRLRGRPYLVADGVSGLRRVPEGPEPAESMSWSFNVAAESSSVRTGFVVSYFDAAASAYGRDFKDTKRSEKEEKMEFSFSDGGWKVTSVKIENEKYLPDTISIGGEFYADYSEIDSSTGFPVGSPLVAYLMNNIFNNTRQSSFCRKSSIHMEEFARMENMGEYSREVPEYRDYWIREGLEFYDEMMYIGNDVVFRRIFDLNGREITRDDYNAFRNFLLSGRNQRYVFVPAR